MLIVNTETVPGLRITQVRGLAQGSTVRAKNVGRDIGASFKSLVGGELRGYTEMMTEARNEALERLSAHATSLGANAVVNVRFTTADIAGGAAEILAYGTAVIVDQAPAGG
ncbi:MAG: YbjQ family protein [Actinomycetota bacterium]|nr:YbjQ family protein [Actinomycetota bacterium]